MASVLSTKKLTPAQRQLLLNAQIDLVEYNAIDIKPIPFSPQSGVIEHAVFTSQNAYYAIKDFVVIKNAYTVGKKTARLLRDNGVNVIETEDTASSLAEKLLQKHSDQHFVFFCGNKRRDELPESLQRHQVSYEQHIVYSTNLNCLEAKGEFDGIMFFSPSAVKSFFMKNTIGNAIAFCIGPTTATAAKEYTQNIHMATSASVENVIVQVVKHSKNNVQF